MNWLLNARESEAFYTINDLTRGNERVLVTGPPQANRTYSVADLERMGLVGIYEKENSQ